MKTKHLLFTIFCLMVSLMANATVQNSKSVTATTYDYEIDMANININAVADKDGYIVTNGGTGNLISLTQINKNYRIYGTTNFYGIMIWGEKTEITLDNANIKNSDFSAIEIFSDLKLTLKGVNTLSGSFWSINSNSNNLTVDGDGSVKTERIYIKKFTLNGGTINNSFNILSESMSINGGVINEGNIKADKTISISGGTLNLKGAGATCAIEAQDSVYISGGIINAEAAGYVYGIWGVNGVVISGGIVKATSLNGDCAINSYSGNIVISGGNVYASGYYGLETATRPQPVNKKGENIYMTALGGMLANTSITNMTAPSEYEINNVKTDANGYLYLWLLEGNQKVAYTVGATNVNKTFAIAPNNKNIFAIGDVNVDVSDAATLKSALEGQLPSTINVTADIIFEDRITAGPNHILNIPKGKTVTGSGNSGININTNMLTIKGGGSFISEKTSGNVLYSLYNAVLNLEDITVILKNSNGNGVYVKTININNAATVILDSPGRNFISMDKDFVCTVNSGGTIKVLNFWDDGIDVNRGTLHINGGTIITNKGDANNRSISISSGGTLKYTSGILNGLEGSTIYFGESSMVEGLNGKFKDQGKLLTSTTPITVGSSEDIASSNSLTRGYYYWDGSLFAKEAITLNSQPQSTSVIEGKIAVVLSVSASASNNEQLSYQWWETVEGGWSAFAIEGETNNTFSIPSNLAEGTYYYFCNVNANKCMEVQSQTAIVTVSNSGNSIEFNEGVSVPTIYPTVTSDIVYVKALSGETVYVYDLSGNLLFETQSDIIDLSKYQKSVYIFQIGTKTTKVVKQ